MRAPPERFEQVAEQVNEMPQIAHNYERDHALNMWFVVAAKSEKELLETCSTIEERTGIEGFNLPKIEEYFVGLYFNV